MCRLRGICHEDVLVSPGRSAGRYLAMRPLGTSGHIRCPKCDQKLLSFGEGWLTLHGDRPAELTNRPNDDCVIIACPGCRTLVPVEPSLLRVY